MQQSSRVEMGFVGLTLLAAALYSSGAHAADSSGKCEMRLVVELTPDVPDSRNPGFLSSLLNNHPEYRLTWVQKDDDTTIVVDLAGPGPADQCQSVLETMRKDGRVESIHSDSDDAPSISVKANASTEDVEPTVRVSRAGLGSLLWAAGHPRQAWKILAPVQSDDASGTYQDLRAACLAEQPSNGEFTACL